MGFSGDVVTGGAGHIGTNLVAALRAAGRQVRVVDLREPATARRLGADWVRADVRDGGRLRAAFDGAAVVYHLANVISITGPQGGLVASVNVDGTRTAAGAAAAVGVGRFVYCGSIHAYDLGTGGAVIDESSPRPGPGAHAYDSSKAAGEEEVRRAADRGLDAVIVSPTGVIGPDDPGPSRMGAVLLALWRRRMPALVAGGFDWVDVRDVAAAMVAAAAHGRGGESYLLPGHRRSVADLARLARDCSGVAIPGAVVPLWLAGLSAPLAAAVTRRMGSQPLLTPEALSPLRAFPVVSGAKAARELRHLPRPLERTVADLHAFFQRTGALP